MLSLALTTVPPAHSALSVGITAQPVDLSFVAAKTPDCPQSVAFTLTPASTFVALSGLAASSGSVTISGATQANHSATPYGFTLGASVDSATAASATFDVTVTDPCSTG